MLNFCDPTAAATADITAFTPTHTVVAGHSGTVAELFADLTTGTPDRTVHARPLAGLTTPRTVTDIHRHHGVIVLTDQYGSTWTYPATSVIPTAVHDPLHIRTSTAANGGTR